jgi:hypothetical protein
MKIGELEDKISETSETGALDKVLRGLSGN